MPKMGLTGRIPGTYGGGAARPDPAPAVPFAEPASNIIGPNSVGVVGRVPNTYGGGANTPDSAPAVRFEGPPPMNDEPLNENFPDNGTPGKAKRWP